MPRRPTKNKLSESDRLLDQILAQVQDLEKLVKKLDRKLNRIQECLTPKEPKGTKAEPPQGILPPGTCPPGYEWDGEKCVWVGP